MVDDNNKKADSDFEIKKDAAKKDKNKAYDLYRNYVGQADTDEERRRRINNFRKG